MFCIAGNYLQHSIHIGWKMHVLELLQEQYFFIELVSKVSKGGFRCDSIDTNFGTPQKAFHWTVFEKKVRETFESSKNNLCGMKGLNIFKNVPKS